jgi:putative GTP pyrophosphokinase
MRCWQSTGTRKAKAPPGGAGLSFGEAGDREAADDVAVDRRDDVADLKTGAFSRAAGFAARAKDPSSFLKKAGTMVKGRPKYKEPLAQIQDQIGARIITFFKSDVDRIDAIVRSFFKPIEFRDRVPESEWEFGYFGRHYVLIVPTDVKGDSIDGGKIPDFFELQVKTLFQHAWSEADHDVGYKPGSKPLTPEEKRKLAYTSAQAWGADQIFDELFQTRSSLTH